MAIDDGKRDTEVLGLDELAPDPKNARKHTPRNLEMVEASLREVGAARSIVLDESNTVLAGNATVKGARSAGIDRVRIIDADGDELIAVRRRNLTPAQKQRLALFDNRAAELAEWDSDMLRQLRDEAVDLNGLFDADELQALLGIDAPTGEQPRELTDADAEAPEPPADPVTQLGDIWTLGQHRIMCGDSTNAAHVAALMAGEKATLLFSDPPYGVAYRATGAGAWNAKKLAKKKAGTLKPRFAAIENDEMTGQELSDFWTRWLQVASAHLVERCAIYCCYASLRAAEVFDAFVRAGFYPRAELIWIKSRPAFNFAHYKHQHEPVLYAAREGGAAPWYGDMTQTTLMQVASESGAVYEHPTQKPVGLLDRPLRNSSLAGEIVFEPFSGSGTAIIGCEKWGRRCFAMELSPAYVDVAVQRWERVTGKRAERVEAAACSPTAA
jgi:DNA modification methylase